MKASDHVVLRYLERVRGIDVEAVRTDIEGLFESTTMQWVAEWTHGASVPGGPQRLGVLLSRQCRDNLLSEA